MYITCCPLSQVCMIFGFVPHPLAYFLISGYLLQTPKNSKISVISLEGLSYRGSTVFDYTKMMPSILHKKLECKVEKLKYMKLEVM